MVFTIFLWFLGNLGVTLIQPPRICAGLAIALLVQWTGAGGGRRRRRLLGVTKRSALPRLGVTVVTVDDGSIGSGLAASSDEVSLYEADGYSVIDAYAFPFNPGNGISAERIDLTGADAPSNWQASTCASSSSPGAVNCP